MARNLKKDNIKKLLAMETSNGFKIDVANYIYNPSYDHEYPSFKKAIKETDNNITFMSVLYFKHYNGGGEYKRQVYTMEKTEGNFWGIAKNMTETIIEESKRFSLKRLTELTESIEV